MKKADRQRRLLEIISARRYEEISRLAEELNVSHDTISRDLNELTESASFYITCGKHGGGVYAVDGWYYSRTYLSTDQEALLRKLLAGLQPEEQKTMQSILNAFAKPTKEANR